jgi:hypothetical protein
MILPLQYSWRGRAMVFGQRLFLMATLLLFPMTVFVVIEPFITGFTLQWRIALAVVVSLVVLRKLLRAYFVSAIERYKLEPGMADRGKAYDATTLSQSMPAPILGKSTKHLEPSSVR